MISERVFMRMPEQAQHTIYCWAKCVRDEARILRDIELEKDAQEVMINIENVNNYLINPR